MQGRAASELVKQFVNEVEKKVDRLNRQCTRLQVLMSGRTLTVQGQATELRREGQILELLPYFVPVDEIRAYKYVDQRNLLQEDQRQRWWQRYGQASGHRYEKMPKVLERNDFIEITSQPLLNYLVALSYTRGKLNFNEESNLNAVYYDLLEAVYERGWAKKQQHPSIKGLEFKGFVRVLEEIGLTTWHGNGRTTTVGEIHASCQQSLQPIFEKFQEGAESGVTRLLTAFYFKQAGVSQLGERTFEFTHKSFGEYLTARRIVRGLERIQKELESRREDLDSGWSEEQALRHWAELCGPTAVDTYLSRFLYREVDLQESDKVAKWQKTLAHLIEFMLRHGMPMHEMKLNSYKRMDEQARNAEGTLSIALSSCALTTRNLTQIDWPDSIAFYNWLTKLRPFMLNVSGLADLFFSLHFYEATLKLNNLCLDKQALIGWGFNHVDVSYSSFKVALLVDAHFKFAVCRNTNFTNADLAGASFEGANLEGAVFKNTDLQKANLEGATVDALTDFGGANLSGATWIDGRICKEGSIGTCVFEDELKSSEN